MNRNAVRTPLPSRRCIWKLSCFLPVNRARVWSMRLREEVDELQVLELGG
jgi:hypothetical protein